MTELDQLIEAAYKSEGKQEAVNTVYLAFLKSILYLPVKKRISPHIDSEEPFTPLFAKVDGKYFMAVFDSEERLTHWAGDRLREMDVVSLSGKEVVNGINDNVYLCLNVDTPFYKEFSPDELGRLKMIVARIDQLLKKD